MSCSSAFPSKSKETAFPHEPLRASFCWSVGGSRSKAKRRGGVEPLASNTLTRRRPAYNRADRGSTRSFAPLGSGWTIEIQQPIGVIFTEEPKLRFRRRLALALGHPFNAIAQLGYVDGGCRGHWPRCALSQAQLMFGSGLEVFETLLVSSSQVIPGARRGSAFLESLGTGSCSLPLPPNRTGGFPASGSPVSGFLPHL